MGVCARLDHQNDINFRRLSSDAMQITLFWNILNLSLLKGILEQKGSYMLELAKTFFGT